MTAQNETEQRAKRNARARERYQQNKEKYVKRSNDWYHANKEKSLASTKAWRANNPEKALQTGRNAITKQRAVRPRKILLCNMRMSARKRGLEFSITESDIEWATHCPVFGVELTYFAKGCRTHNSASFDRFDNSLGYIPGNVRVVSWRVNELKRDATVEEMRKVLTYMESLFLTALL